MDRALLGHRYAKSAVDVACWDVLGKACGQPVTTLLGGRRQASFPLYVAVPLGPADAMAAYVAARRAEGIHRFQLKLGADPHEDAARVRGVLAATTGEDIVIADANGGWRMQEAVVAARLLEGLDRVFFEQPCPTLEECLYVRQRTTLPMVLDEASPTCRRSCAPSTPTAMEAINLKISKVGGLTRARQIRELAEYARPPADDRGHLGRRPRDRGGQPSGREHPPEALFTVSFMNDWTNEHVAGYEPRSRAASASAPPAPGLGVEVDPERLARRSSPHPREAFILEATAAARYLQDATIDDVQETGREVEIISRDTHVDTVRCPLPAATRPANAGLLAVPT